MLKRSSKSKGPSTSPAASDPSRPRVIARRLGLRNEDAATAGRTQFQLINTNGT